MHVFQENISTNKSLTCALGVHVSISLSLFINANHYLVLISLLINANHYLVFLLHSLSTFSPSMEFYNCLDGIRAGLSCYVSAVLRSVARSYIHCNCDYLFLKHHFFLFLLERIDSFLFIFFLISLFVLCYYDEKQQ